MVTTYYVTAHQGARRRFLRESVPVYQDPRGGYFARHPALGCGANSSGPIDALIRLLRLNDCDNILIEREVSRENLT